ncbi:MAG: hypothetical protein QME60_01395 [Verrucomicrobiota bacterium]|nr:hypothetical protein [Verrucomicrobiota bacterium]
MMPAPASDPALEDPITPKFMRTMPVHVKLLADNYMADPRKGLKTHADAAGLSLSEARRLLSRTDVREYVDECLDQAGATVEASCRAIAEALGAVRIVGTTADPDDAKKKIPIHTPDHEYRLRAAEMNLKLRGLLQQSVKDESPMTLAQLVAAVHEERKRRALDVTPSESTA